MLDQATRLRQLAAAFRTQAAGGSSPDPTPGPVQSPALSPAPRRRTQVIAVTSGKGGVGKTNLSVNLGQALVNQGNEVILLDADLGLANADILLGTVPPYHLGHMLRGERQIDELIHRTPGRLQIIAGGSGVEELANLPDAQLQTFVQALARLDGRADYLLLDTGAGLSHTVMEFVLAADQVLVVTTPEPPSLADGYATIKTLAHRRPGVDVKVIINQAEQVDEAAAAAERIVTTARNFLGLAVEHLGTVPRDPHVWQAVRRQKPFLLAYPGSPAARSVTEMAARLSGPAPGSGASSPPGTKTTGFFDRLTSLFRRQAI